MPTCEDIRRIALALPEAYEAPHFEATSFRVKTKIFCTLDPDQPRATLKFDPEDQRNLVAAYPHAVAPVDGYWGRNGWTIVDGSDLEPEILADLLRMSWAGVAPKRLLKP